MHTIEPNSPRAWTPYPGAMNIKILVESYMDMITMQFFFNQHVWEYRKRFLRYCLFAYFAPPMRPRGWWCITFHNDISCSFHVKLLSRDAQRPMDERRRTMTNCNRSPEWLRWLKNWLNNISSCRIIIFLVST